MRPRWPWASRRALEIAEAERDRLLRERDAMALRLREIGDGALRLARVLPAGGRDEAQQRSDEAAAHRAQPRRPARLRAMERREALLAREVARREINEAIRRASGESGEDIEEPR